MYFGKNEGSESTRNEMYKNNNNKKDNGEKKEAKTDKDCTS
jgi:hypothetical protein